MDIKICILSSLGKHRSNGVLTLLLLLMYAGTAMAQENIIFERITTNDGLSQSDINCIYQDQQGFMWFGTHDGLNKYDGYGFTIYNPNANKKESINSNLIYDVIGDSKGNLWIGTTGRGLNYFDRSTETFRSFIHVEGDEGSLGNDHVSSVLQDSKDRLWVGTSTGLDMLDLRKPLDSVVFQRYHLEQATELAKWDGKIIYDVYEDGNHQLLVGGLGGLYKLSRDENGDIYFRPLSNTLDLPDVIVRCISEDKSGRLLIGTDDGLYIQEKNYDYAAVQKVAEGTINAILVDDHNNIWCGTNDGLQYFDNTDVPKVPKLIQKFSYNPLDKNSLSKNIVRSLHMDRTGIIWVGTNGGGVNKFDPNRKQFLHIRKTLDPNSLSYDKIRAMYEDSNGTLWIGTEGGGLNMLLKEHDDGSYSRFQSFQDVSNPFAITEIQNGKKKSLLIGVEGSPGLYELDITNPDVIGESDIVPVPQMELSVFSMLEDSNSNLWVGTYGGGVQRWIPKTGETGYEKDVFTFNSADPNSFPSNIVRNIFEDKKGDIWFATADGLSRLTKSEKSKKNPKFQVFRDLPGDVGTISHNYILSLFESSDGTMWIGTFGGGLNKVVSPEGGAKVRFKSYAEREGLPNNVIKGILEDDEGNLWLSTNQGLSRFDIQQETFKNYDVNDGLQNNEFQELACLKRKDGQMLFGGINGFNAFYPKEIGQNTLEAETVITDFSISNESVEIGKTTNGRVILNNSINATDHIKLKYIENNFSFEFAALHYAAPKKNKFAYMLEGFDQDWIYASSAKRFATYTNLEPGLYTLKVRASNNDGLWDKTPSEIKIEVTPPFWRTNTAYVFYGLCILGLLWLFWRYTFIRTTEKHQLELEHLEKEQLEEMQRIKLEFFTNISHEFRTPLTLIKGPLEYLQKKGNSLKGDVIQEQYTLMHKNTNYLMRLVNQLLDFRKINQGKMRLVVRNTDIVDFVKEVAEPFQFLAHKKKVDFKVVTSDNALNTWFDHDALEKVLNNLLSNAFKYTPANGSVKVSISKEPDKDEIVVFETQSKAHGCVVIEVKDSGSGISKDKLKNVFERYYTERIEDGSNQQGFGIGLSFTKNLVELHQGTIEVMSEPGRGTNFKVRLPMKKEAYLNIEEISCKEVSDNDFLVRSSESESFAIGINDEIVDESLSKSRSKLPVLLVVDDNAEIRSFIKQSLIEDYAIYEAADGQQGLEVAEKVMPNIVLSDVVMPGMDGLELCRLLKTKKETSHIPVIMLTAKSSEESAMEGLKTGADDYLTKPFNMELLKVKLANIITQRGELRKRFNRDIAIQPSEVTVTSADEKFLNQAMEIVEKHMMNTDFNVEMLVKEMGLSRSNLYLKFKELTGLSSSEFIRNVRLKRAVQLFDSSDLSVKEIMYMTGFNTASYFSKCFKKQFGVIPSEYIGQIKKTGEASGT